PPVRSYHAGPGPRPAPTVGTPEFRHYFFDFGPHCTVAFFEYADVAIEPFAKPAGVPDARASQFDHLALNLPDENALHDLRQRLTDADRDGTDTHAHRSAARPVGHHASRDGLLAIKDLAQCGRAPAVHAARLELADRRRDCRPTAAAVARRVRLPRRSRRAPAPRTPGLRRAGRVCEHP